MNMSKIKLCIFDMDGLLLDTERYVWDIAKRNIGKEYGLDISSQLSADLIGLGTQVFAEEIKKQFGMNIPAEEYAVKVKEYYANYCINNDIPLKPGVMELFKFLKENNIYISLGTSTDEKLAKVALKKTGLLEYFDYAVFGNQVKNGKPNPEIYLKSVEHYRFNPDECIVFEDALSGAKAAYDGNINFILVPDLKQPTQEYKEKALAIINTLQEAIPIISKINNI